MKQTTIKIRVINPEDHQKLAEIEAVINLKGKGLRLPSHIIEQLRLQRSEYYFDRSEYYLSNEDRDLLQAKLMAQLNYGESYYGQALLQIDNREGLVAVCLEKEDLRPTVGEDILKELGIVPRLSVGVLIISGLAFLIGTCATMGSVLSFPNFGTPEFETEMAILFVALLMPFIYAAIAIAGIVFFVGEMRDYRKNKKTWEETLSHWQSGN